MLEHGVHVRTVLHFPCSAFNLSTTSPLLPVSLWRLDITQRKMTFDCRLGTVKREKKRWWWDREEEGGRGSGQHLVNKKELQQHHHWWTGGARKKGEITKETAGNWWEMCCFWALKQLSCPVVHTEMRQNPSLGDSSASWLHTAENAWLLLQCIY